MLRWGEKGMNEELANAAGQFIGWVAISALTILLLLFTGIAIKWAWKLMLGV